MSDISFNADILAVIAIISITILFYLYNYLTEYKILSELISRIIQTSHSYQSIQFFTEKSSGILLLGIIPFLLFVCVLDIMPASQTRVQESRNFHCEDAPSFLLICL